MKLRLMTIAALFCLLAGAAHSQTYYLFDTTINAPQSGDAWVGWNGLTATNPTVNLVTGGSIGGNLFVRGGTVNATGGSVAGAISVSAISTYPSTVNINGGSFGGPLLATYNGTINLYGYGLSSASVTTDYFGFLKYELSGHLADHTDITGKTLYTGSNGAFTLNNSAPVPEPAFVQLGALLGCSGIGLLRRRRRA